MWWDVEYKDWIKIGEINIKIDLAPGEIQSTLYALKMFIPNQEYYERNCLNYTKDSGNLGNAKTAFNKLIGEEVYK